MFASLELYSVERVNLSLKPESSLSAVVQGWI